MTVTELAPVLSGPGLTASVAAQLRAAADFLENTPGLKVSAFTQAPVFFALTAAEVDEMAALTGTEARWEGHHYFTEKRFGTEVAYRAVHICKGHCKPPSCAETAA